MLTLLLNTTINASIYGTHMDYREQLCVENCDQTGADSDMVTIDSLRTRRCPI